MLVLGNLIDDYARDGSEHTVSINTINKYALKLLGFVIGVAFSAFIAKYCFIYIFFSSEDAIVSSLIHSFSWNPTTFLHAYTCHPFSYATRQAVGAILQDIADSGVLFATLVCKHKVIISLVGAQKASIHPDDMLLLANFFMSSESFRQVDLMHFIILRIAGFVLNARWIVLVLRKGAIGLMIVLVMRK
ncbi:vacuolar fusion protein MON1 protein [Trifolium repens]|nr:vacuolar fusion protein MON1 protein [Trifolium repens]